VIFFDIIIIIIIIIFFFFPRPPFTPDEAESLTLVSTRRHLLRMIAAKCGTQHWDFLYLKTWNICNSTLVLVYLQHNLGIFATQSLYICITIFVHLQHNLCTFATQSLYICNTIFVYLQHNLVYLQHNLGIFGATQYLYIWCNTLFVYLVQHNLGVFATQSFGDGWHFFLVSCIDNLRTGRPGASVKSPRAWQSRPWPSGRASRGVWPGAPHSVVATAWARSAGRDRRCSGTGMHVDG
jgi:hypothetical protein